MDKKLTQSKKAQLSGVGIGTILTLIQAFGLSSTVGGYIIGAIIIANILGQAWQDGKKAGNDTR